MYETDVSIRLHQTDAAGVLFFGNYFYVAHDVYEQYMQSIGFDFRTIINESSYLILIVHAEGDFHKPVYVGDTVLVAMSALKIGHTSFELVYRLMPTNSPQAVEKQDIATVRTVHVAVDKESGRPVPLPERLKTGLEKLL